MTDLQRYIQNMHFSIICQDCVGMRSISHKFRPVTRFHVEQLREVLAAIKGTSISMVSSEIPLPRLAGYVMQREAIKLLYHVSEETFEGIWSQGVPIVVMGVGINLQLAWSPEYFIENHGNKNCVVEETSTGTERKTTVAEFFRSFGRYDQHRPVERLKVSRHYMPRNCH